MAAKFQGRNVFVTVTNIAKHFDTTEGGRQIEQIFGELNSEKPRYVWERSSDSNEHVHIVYTLVKSTTFRRSLFSDLLQFFETKSLNIQTWSRRKTYSHTLSGKTHKSKPDLWLFEKIYYCDLPAHEEYFDKTKLATKKPTVVRVASNEKTALYNRLKKTFDSWLAEKANEAQMKPKDVMTQKVFGGLTQDDLDDFVDDPSATFRVRAWALENYEKLVKQIDTLDRIRSNKRLRALYSEEKAKYRPFQHSLSEILDTQNDRNIHVHVDSGLTGKNKFCDVEGLRQDTCLVQSACTKDIAFAWDPKKHKRIIVDVPKGKMRYLNTSALEKLKNGLIFSTKYVPVVKKSEFKPSIVVLGNEPVDDSWTEDRLTCSSTHRNVNYEIRMNCSEPLKVSLEGDEF